MVGSACVQNVRENSAARGYGHKWRAARATFLQAHPLCVMCEQRGRTSAATVVDHIEPHRNDRKLFWDRKNWQALCQGCHDRHKQRLEKSGTAIGCTVDGLPLDPSHWWRQPDRQPTGG